ncbi:MAG: ABC transporter ATP-binding protein [Spirochaetes bacterium]|nr:ABC transporter ATP-binding protein [Spirochaetota bacterium]
MEKKQIILSVKSVSKIYRMGEVDVPALRDATLDIYDGEFLIIVGPSGSGKSTLLNLIGGMDRPTRGRISFQETVLSAVSDKDLTLYRRNKVGFIFQFYNLIPTLTALENVQVAVEIAQDTLDPMEALATVGLQDRADHFPAQLSGGEQQRVSIARALSGNPDFILCDEPTGALDLEASKNILGLLVDLNRELKKTVVLITHNSAIAEIGHRVALVRDGSIHSIRSNEPPKPVEQISW